MSTKMKGLLKGLRYISQIFDEEDTDQEIEIGFPTDVKHVAHIGSDGPSDHHETPSWMKEFKTETESDQIQAPSMVSQSQREDRGIKSELRGSKSQKPASLPDLPRSSRRNLLSDKSECGSPLKKEAKANKSRRQSSKEYSEGGAKSTRKLQDASTNSAISTSRELPEVPKKTRRKKSKELSSGGSGSSKLRVKGDDNNGSCSSNYSENASDSKAILQTSEPHRAKPIPNLDGDYR